MRSLVLIAHGSHHHAAQAQALHRCAEVLRAQNGSHHHHFDEVVEGYWQGEPSLRQVLKTVQFTDVTVLPVGITAGRLSEVVWPRELGLGHQGPVPAGGVTRVMGGRTVHYLPPFPGPLDLLDGPEHSEDPEYINELYIAQLLAWLESEQASRLGGDLDLGHQAAWGALLRRAEQGMRLGEVLITAQAGLFELRHALDEGRSSETLSTYVTLTGLHGRVRQAEDGGFRSQPALRTLARGWRAVVARAELPRALAELYPAAVEEGYAHHNHALRSTPWVATAQRRGGTLAQVSAQVQMAQVQAARAQWCSRCLKTPIWAGETLHQTFFAGVPGGLPCAEACTLLIDSVQRQCEQAVALGGG